MKEYPEYKEIQNSWVDSIPSHWRYLKLKHFVKLHGRIGWKGLTTDDYIDDGIILLGVRNITTDYNLDTTVISRIPIEKYDESPEIKVLKGDILLAKTGATIGKCCVIYEVPEPMTVNAAVNIFRVRSENHSKYFMYFIASDLIQQQFYINISSNAQGNLFQRDIREIYGYLPKYEEQSKIASFLDHKIHQIDDLIAKKQKLIELLKEERTALINHAVTKGIDPKVPMKDSGIEWVGEIPENWEVKRLKFLSKTVQTGNTPPSEKIEYYENPDIDWFTPSDFGDNLYLRDSKRKIHSNAINDGVAKLFNPFSVLIIGIGATLGKIGIIDTYASSNQQINSIEFNDFMNPTFAAFYLRTFESVIKNMSNAATLAILNQSNTKNIVFICPPKEDQDKIARYIEEKVSYVELMNSRITKEIELISEYKTSLINETVTGKIDVRDYQINHA